MARSLYPTMTLAERTGDKRTLVLSGRAMPFRPVAFPATTRRSRTSYQGNPDATIQMFGPDYQPIRMRGSWRDWWLTGTTATLDYVPIRTVAKLLQTVRSLWLAGQELDLVWDEERYRVVLADFAPTYQFNDFVDWEMTFDVVGFGLTEATAGYLPAFDVASAATSLLAGISSFLSSAQAALRKIQALRAQVTGYLDRIDRLRSQLENVITTVADVALSPLTLASRLIQTVTDLTQVYAAIQRVADMTNAAVAAVTGSASELVRAYTGRAELSGAARTAARDARQTTAAARRQISPRVLKVVVSRQEVDLRRVAAEVYGDQEGWQTIAAYNGLSGSTAPPGRWVLVPERV
jgi:hypothetical protein